MEKLVQFATQSNQNVYSIPEIKVIQIMPHRQILGGSNEDYEDGGEG